MGAVIANNGTHTAAHPHHLTHDLMTMPNVANQFVNHNKKIIKYLNDQTQHLQSYIFTLSN